ncbi:MAG: hypothetical protein F6K47_10175, partial [Symploca sp. SIO2E6]|nr:hypothetical protein [Symploca sp. SIO2E6]
ITHYSLLITHYSLLITHYSLLITHYSLLITHYSLLITHYSLLLALLEITPLYQICSYFSAIPKNRHKKCSLFASTIVNKLSKPTTYHQ